MHSSRIPGQRQAAITADWLIDLLGQREVSLARVSQALEIPPQNLASRQVVLSLKTYNALFEWAAKELRDETLGIHVGQQLDISQIGILGYILRNSPTLGDFFESLERYIAVFQRGASMHFTVHGGLAHYRYHFLTVDIPAVRQDVEFTLSMLVQFLRNQLGSNWRPAGVFFEHAAPVNLDVHYEQFGDAIHFGCTYTGVSFDEVFLAAQVSESDPRLLKLMQNQANVLLSEIDWSHDFVKHISLLITASLGRETVSAEEVASEVNMTRRTLHRHLKALGTSFQKLRDEIIVDIAIEALTETGVSITGIAMQLGYSEVSAFIRSFKRLTGVCPLQYRKQAQKL